MNKISTTLTKTKENAKQNLQILQPIKNIAKKYSKFYLHIAIILIAITIALFNVLAKEETVTLKDSSILANLALPDQEKFEIVKNTDAQPVESSYLSIISIASASQTGGAMNINKNAIGSTAIKTLAKQSKSLPVFNNDTLVKNGSVQTVNTKSKKNKKRKEPFKHFVVENDTISSIAYKFGIDPATILVENDLYADDIIKPGMELVILPISGASKTVESGETLEQIANAYEADIDEIIKFNKLAKADSIKQGQILIIPDGTREIKERPLPEPEIQETLIATYEEEYSNTYEAPQTVYQTPVVQPRGNVGNHFPWGQCTWYAAERRGDVSWMGNAGEWLWNAQAQGRSTGRIPAVGAILVTSESWWGHVSIVEAVNGDQVSISEMNYAGFGITSTRTISNSSGVIKGYIY